jgi:hypothetical protein
MGLCHNKRGNWRERVSPPLQLGKGRRHEFTQTQYGKATKNRPAWGNILGKNKIINASFSPFILQK